jgi:hypothetical protein
VEEFTLSTLAEIARMPKRAVQLWADAGVIKANPSTMLAGSGVHRRFKREEVIVACILAPFAKQKMAIGGLQSAASTVRRYLGFGKRYPLMDIIERAVAGRHNNYLLAFWADGKDGELVISDWNIESDANRDRSFFDVFKPSDADKRWVKIDVIPLNEVLRDLPAKP